VPYNTCNGREEPEHHYIGHHLPAEFLGKPGGRDREQAGTPPLQPFFPNQILVDDDRGFGLEELSVCVLRLLGHENEDVGPRDLGIVDQPLGDNHVCTAGPTPGLGPIALGEDRILPLEEGNTPAEDVAGEHDALTAEPGQTNLHSSLFPRVGSGFGVFLCRHVKSFIPLGNLGKDFFPVPVEEGCLILVHKLSNHDRTPER